MAPSQAAHRHQQHMQLQEPAVVLPSRPSIADMLSGSNSSAHEDDNDAQSVSVSSSSRRPYPPSPAVTRSQCSDGSDSGSKATTITTSSQSRHVSDRPKISDAFNCSSTTGDLTVSIHGSISSTHRLQKQTLVASPHGRTVSQMFSPQTDYGSMLSGLNYSLPQLSNTESIDLYASQNGLNSNAENLECTQYRRGDAGNKPSQGVGVEGGLKSQDELLGASVSSTHPSRREEEERRIAEFTAIEQTLKTSLSAIDNQLENIQTTCTSLSSSTDLETLENIGCQFSHCEHQLIQLTTVSGDILEVADGVELVKTVQDKVTEITAHVAATRKRLDDVRTKVQAVYDKHHSSKVELNQLMDWLSDAQRRLAECTERPSVNTVTAEQQLGLLLTLIHEFAARKNRFQDLVNCTGLDHNSVMELCHEFERTSETCRVSLESHRQLFAGLTDIRNSVHQIASWVAKIGPIYSLDSGSAAGSLDMLEDNHAELENRLEEASQLKEKIVEFLASLRTAEGQTGQGQWVEGHHENESSLMQPLLEVQCQLYQLRELIATRAASMVSISPGRFTVNSCDGLVYFYISTLWV